MLETIRKGYWKADAETTRRLAAADAGSVVRHGEGCSGSSSARCDWRRFLAGLQAGRADVDDFARLDLTGYPARPQRLVRAGDRDGFSKCLEDLELDMARRLSWLTFATRVGPMIGLIGTLLPLGPALRGLASEDLGSLARNLEVAFTSTVFGLLVGGLAYAANVARRNWYDQDLSDLESVLDARHRTDERVGLGAMIRGANDA